MNCQTAARSDSVLPTLQPIRHINEYAADLARVYIAPEARDGSGDPLVLTLTSSRWARSAIICSQKSLPRRRPLELPEKLQRLVGLRISHIVDGVGRDLDDLSQMGTAPEVARRISSVQEFLAYLSNEEQEFHAGPTKGTVDPEGVKPDDPIGHDLVLVERLGNAGLATPIRGRSAHSR